MTAIREGRGLELGDRRVLRPGKWRWLRALGWGAALFFIFMLADAGASILPGAVMNLRGPLNVAVTLALTVLALAAYAGAVRLVENRWPTELEPRTAAFELLAGLVLGATMITAVVGALVLLGQYQVSGPRSASPWGMISVGITSGALEELIMRAIVLRLTMRAFGLWPALIFQAALFGALHLANPNASAVAAIAIALEAGLMLAAFYLLTGRIWVSIGLHAAWNFTQGWVWGAPVSGLAVTNSLFVSKLTAGASPVVSGGAFGPEASAPAMIIGTSVAIGTLVLAARSGRLKIANEATPLRADAQAP